MDGTGFNNQTTIPKIDATELDWIKPDNFDIQHAMLQQMRNEGRRPDKHQSMKLEPHCAVPINGVLDSSAFDSHNDHIDTAISTMQDALALDENDKSQKVHLGVLPNGSEIEKENGSALVLMVAVSDLLKANAISPEFAGNYAEHRRDEVLGAELVADS